jgi:hypothetical protein
MKKTILSLAILASISLTSCSSDESNGLPNTVTAGTGKVAIKFTAPQDAPLTGKNVDRGTIPITIKSIEVTATNTNAAILPTKTNFEFGTGAGFTAGNYFIEKVTSGDNTFKAETTSAGTEITENKLSSAKFLADVVIDNYKKQTPYAHYEDAYAATTITLDTPQELSFAITTNNGRLIIEAGTDPTLTAMARKITITGQKYAKPGTNTADKIGSLVTVDITGDLTVAACWSDHLSIAGAHVDYTFNIYDPSGNNIEKSFNKTYVIKKSTGSVVRDLITYQGITEDIDYATFVVDPWLTDGI